MELDCRNKTTLEDGYFCVHTKEIFFNLHAPDGTLLVQFLNEGKFFLLPVFRDAQGRELARVRIKFGCPILIFPNEGDEPREQKIELPFFRCWGHEFCPYAEVPLLGTKITCQNGLLSADVDGLDADKQHLIKAILCFCMCNKRAAVKFNPDYQLILLFILIFLALAHR